MYLVRASGGGATVFKRLALLCKDTSVRLLVRMKIVVMDLLSAFKRENRCLCS